VTRRALMCNICSGRREMAKHKQEVQLLLKCIDDRRLGVRGQSIYPLHSCTHESLLLCFGSIYHLNCDISFYNAFFNLCLHTQV
jgi:hypothetical protein